MIPTPRQVAPVVEPVFAPLREALRDGSAWAETLQPDPERDPFFWSHSARFRARNLLRDTEERDGWVLVPKVNNCGIHLRVADLHVVRVLRSLGGTTPHPGPNQARQEAYVQGQLDLAPGGDLPPLSLIADWQVREEEPVIHLGLPAEPWNFRRSPRLHWRVLLPGDGLDLDSLVFEPGPDDGSMPVTLKIDPAEDTELAE